MLSRIPPITRFLAVVTLAFTTLFFILRIAFWLAFDNPATPLDTVSLLQAFSVGLRFDLRLALLVLLPLILLAWPELPLRLASGIARLLRRVLRPVGLLRTEQTLTARLLGSLIAMPDRLHARLHALHPLEGNIGRHLARGYLLLAALLLLLFYIGDFGHYAYLQTRIDASVLRFLDNPLISAQMVWESYPVTWIALALLVTGVLLTLLTKRLMNTYIAQSLPPRSYRQRVLIGTLTFVLILLGLWGKFSQYPLRWSDAFFSTNTFASATALNPVLYFSETFMLDSNTYDEERVREFYPLLADYLGIDRPDAQALNFTRQTGLSDHRLPGQPNVVVVIMESFASYKTSLSGNPLATTPYMEALARDGIYFPHYFSPATGTARSVFTFVTGIPDTVEATTASSDPQLVDQHTIISELDGYQSYYFLGGSASWRNIRGLLSHNIPGIRIYEEGSYEAPIQDVWGISDLDLFREANQVLAAESGPFFAIIQTSGNHRPYTIPDDNDGFELMELSDVEVERAGFRSLAELNAFRFMDHCVGRYIEMARQEPYFDNTIFVFFGDHGIGGYAGEHQPLTEGELGLGNLRVPLVLYAPQLLSPQQIDNPASEVDVMPTLAGLVTDGYLNTTLGRDLLDPRFADRRYAFTIKPGRNPQVGVVGNGHYFFKHMGKGDAQLWALEGEQAGSERLAAKPELGERMKQLSVGIYETARYLLHHNNPDKTAPQQQ